MILPFFFSLTATFEGFMPPSFEKISAARQANSSQAQIADLSSRNAVNFSSACATIRFPVITVCVCNEDCLTVRIKR
jgi:hypothetical protein